MTARARQRLTWPSGLGSALTVGHAAAILVAGLIVGEAPGPTLAAAAAAVLVAWVADLHRPRLVLSIGEDLPGLVFSAVAATATVVVLGTAPVAFAVLALACLVLAHTFVLGATHLLRRSGWRARRRVLVVGTGQTARSLALTLLTRPGLGLTPVGFVGTGPGGGIAQARGLPLPLLGPVSSLPRAMTEARVDAVVVALPGPAGEAETAALEGLLATCAEVYAVPTWLPPIRARARHPRELVGGVPVVRLHRRGPWPPVRVLRRMVEVLIALLTLVALLPLAAVLAVLVRVETGGVLVRRRRVDEGRGSVAVPRFRTRHVRSVGRPGTTFSVAISGRLGPVGRLLRRTHLDGLPELLVTLLRRVRYAGGVATGGRVRSAAPTSADQTQVDAGQLAG